MYYFKFELTNKEQISSDSFEYTFSLKSKPQYSYLLDMLTFSARDNAVTEKNTDPIVFHHTPDSIRSENEQFSYKPGQYVWILLDNLIKEDLRGNRRAFSISSSAQNQSLFSIIFREGQSGYKQTLLQLAIGSEVSVSSARGSEFSFSANSEDDTVFHTCLIAKGVGVAPFISILRSQKNYSQAESGVEAEYFPKDHHTTLLLYDYNLEHAMHTEELSSVCSATNTTLIKTNTTFPVEFTQSEHFFQTHFYISGSQTMVNQVYSELSRLNIPQTQIHFEQFYPSSKDTIENYLLSTTYPDQDSDHQSLTNDPSIQISKKNPFQMLIDTTSTHLVITDNNGLILYANKAAQQITGFTFDEMKGSTPRLWGGVMSPDYYSKMWHTLKVEKKPFLGEVTNQRKDGSYYKALGRITPILENDCVIGFVASEEDITDRVSFEYKLLQSEFKYRNLVEMTQDTYFFFSRDSQGMITYVSPAVREILGYEPSDLRRHITKLPLTDHPINKIIQISDNHSPALEISKKDDLNNLNANYEIELFHQSGAFVWLEISETVVHDQGGTIVSIESIAKNITNQKEVDRMKTEFISLASHQLRTPLSTISWYLEMLKDGDAGALSADQAKFIDEAYIGSVRMVELVNALLNVARIEAGTFMIEPVQTNLVQLVRSVLDELKLEVDNKNQHISLLKEHVSEILLDPAIMRIVIHNLITNAIKYTQENGEITISIDEISAGVECGFYLELPIQAKEDSLLLTVKDTGLGIPLHEQDKIFTKMYRANNVVKTDTKGTGLGLYMVKHIIEQSGGIIWFNSVENEGTQFHILIPTSGMQKKLGQKKLESAALE